MMLHARQSSMGWQYCRPGFVVHLYVDIDWLSLPAANTKLPALHQFHNLNCLTVCIFAGSTRHVVHLLLVFPMHLQAFFTETVGTCRSTRCTWRRCKLSAAAV